MTGAIGVSALNPVAEDSGKGERRWYRSQICKLHYMSIYHTLPFRWTQVKKKGPLQTPKPLIFFGFPISENVDVEIIKRGNFEKISFLPF